MKKLGKDAIFFAFGHSLVPCSDFPKFGEEFIEQMQGWFHITFPLTDPVQIFLLTLFIILVAPLLFRKLKIPGILGLILAGMLVGPHGLNLLISEVNFRVFSTVGLIYLMFLMGLELDFGGFRKYFSRTITFGLLTFLIPFLIGFYFFRYFLHYELLSSLLIASSFSTHTLLSYPIVRRLGIHKDLAVTITIGATIITDTAVLIVLNFVADNAVSGNKSGIIGVGIAMLILIILTLWGIPRLGKWFFRVNKGDGNTHFVFVLFIVFLSAFAGQLLGIEPIIGAFLSGLALNSIVPPASQLMNRLAFFGNALFIPFFLLSIGMIIDIEKILESYDVLKMGLILLSIGLVSKFLAALVVQVVLRMSGHQRDVMFGLSSSHAAAILVVLMVGYRLELIDNIVLNGTLIFILGSSLVSSFVTEAKGKKLLISEPAVKKEFSLMPERILVPIANPDTISTLTEIAFAIKNPVGEDPVFPLAVIPDEDASKKDAEQSFQQVFRTVTRLGLERDTVHPLTLVDINISQSIIRTVKEMVVSKVVMGWSGSTGTDFLFGKLRDNILAGTERMVIIAGNVRYMYSRNKILTILPPFAEFETGFREVIVTIYHLALNTRRTVELTGAPNAIIQSVEILKENRPGIDFQTQHVNGYPDFQKIQELLGPKDLLVLIAARPGTISYQPAMENLFKKFFREMATQDVIAIYPAQQEIDPAALINQLETVGSQIIAPQINQFSAILKKIINFIAGKITK